MAEAAGTCPVTPASAAVPESPVERRGAAAARSDQAGLSDRAGGVRHRPRPHASGLRGTGLAVDLALRLRRHCRRQRLVDHLRALAERGHVQPPRGQQVAAVTVASYLTGWGPVLWAAYAFVALENLARVGSVSSQPIVLCSLLGMAIGQFCLSQGWFPSELSPGEPLPGGDGRLVLFFVIRMAGAIMEQNETAIAQKEGAERTLRLSQDQVPFVDSGVVRRDDDPRRGRRLSLRVPGDHRPVAVPAGRARGQPSTGFVQPDNLDTVRSVPGGDFQAGSGTAMLGFRLLRKDGTSRDVEAVFSNETTPLGGSLRRQHPRRHRAQEVRGSVRAPRPARSRHGTGQTAARPRPAEQIWCGRNGPVCRWRRCSSTSTTSRIPTTRSATERATSCCRWWPGVSSAFCARGHGRTPRWRRVRATGRRGLLRPRARDDRRAGPRGAQAGLPHSGDR